MLAADRMAHPAHATRAVAKRIEDLPAHLVLAHFGLSPVASEWNMADSWARGHFTASRMIPRTLAANDASSAIILATFLQP